MESIFDRLRKYDLFGYLFPGMLVLLALENWLVHVFDISEMPFSNDFLNVIVFFLCSYFIGTLVGEISHIKIINTVFGVLPSAKALVNQTKESSAIFSVEEKEMYYKLAKENFGINCEDRDEKKSQQIFEKFLTAVQFEGKDEKPQLHDAYYGMYRNVTVGSILIFILYITSAFILYRKGFNVFDTSMIIILIVSFFSAVLFYIRTRRFARKYVKYVFRVYAEICRNQRKKWT